MLKEFFKLLLGAILFVVLATILLITSAWLGFGFGHLLELGAGGALEGVFGTNGEQIPTITAWLFVSAAVIGVRKKLEDE